ncbi:MAG: DUF3343 domain-containing protein [Clostridia bacterium]|nr:DUF3343 domain-containing protein [Clostridia bacterium]
MQKYMIVTPSVTYALKGRDALRRMGFPAVIERRNGSSGCGYGIVTGADIKKAESILNDASVKILEITDY